MDITKTDIDLKGFEKIVPKIREYNRAAVWFSRKRKQLIFSEAVCRQLNIKPTDRVDIYRNGHNFIMQKSKAGLFTVRYYNRKQENEYTSCCLTGDSVLLEIGTYIDDDAEMVFSVLDNGKGLLFKQWEEENE